MHQPTIKFMGFLPINFLPRLAPSHPNRGELWRQKLGCQPREKIDWQEAHKFDCRLVHRVAPGQVQSGIKI